MIDPVLIDEAYSAYEQLSSLAPLRAQSPLVRGDGPLNAPVVLVGEAPGEQEVKTGRPFTGPSGKLLDQLLDEAGLPRWVCYVTNVVCYRPPGNRTPESFEISASRERLYAEIWGVQPVLVITLGATARRALEPQGEPVSECHGQLEQVEWFRDLMQGYRFMMLPTYHPSAGLRDDRVLAKMRADLAGLPRWQEVIG